ncbi:hypothetical protein CYJ76_03070 [Kytococcus schroeteri]|uniref:MaoC-like domain-containing protein n=1 Tax=Kytococcus schroeteri TaxID=138300 RepID=A0A2I1PCG9_9MICO|nr:MaoC/PaaZ C-terminal domain-containing protein [Kytococcus schroeteri]PKZ42291.1 hypothetical protein CYJ76_03070 [Kytococcus schroeteri]
MNLPTPSSPPAVGEQAVPDVDVELLDAVPSPVSLFGRAVRARGRSTVCADDLPSRRLVVAEAGWTPGELAAYSRLCGFRYGAPVSATWLHVRTFGLQMQLMTAPDFPLKVLGLVHLANRWRVHAPVAPDAVPAVTLWADRLVPHPKGALVTLAATAEVDGQRVWEGWSEYLARGVEVTGASEGAPSGGSRDPAEAAGPASAVDAAALPERARWRLAADTGRRYAAVAGDANPIHLSALTARAFGFKRAIAHGMYTAARSLAALEPHVPDAYAYDVAFAKPLHLPSTVVLATGRTGGGADPSGRRGVQQVAVRATDPSVVHMTGTLRAL